MLADFALHAASRVASDAVGSVARWAIWGAIAALFATCAVVFATVALYFYLLPSFGSIAASAIIAGGATAIALICLAAPAWQDARDRQAAKRASKIEEPVPSTAEALSKDAEIAVDYFGPLQVVTSAFLVGLRTGRQLTAHRTPTPPTPDPG